MNLEWQTGKVIHIIDETYNTKRFFIETKEPFNFTPGQFITLDLPIHEKKNKRWRSYSIASYPDGGNVLELIIVLVEGGIGSTYLFNEVEIGTELLFRGPTGVFVLPNNIEHDYFFICTGTGIAPFRSMILDVYHKQKSTQQINLIFGTRTQKDLLYHQELKNLQEQMPFFNYIPTLSREDWTGRTGYVHDIYEELCKNKPNAQFMLCGWKNMIDDARKKLVELGYDKHNIHFELYG